jgi:hypothetical protein
LEAFLKVELPQLVEHTIARQRLQPLALIRLKIVTGGKLL